MAVFRVEHTHNYTVMCNHHLRDKHLSLKAKGLLSVMLSLPDNWNYSIIRSPIRKDSAANRRSGESGQSVHVDHLASIFQGRTSKWTTCGKPAVLRPAGNGRRPWG